MSNHRTRIEKIERGLQPVSPGFVLMPRCKTKAEHDAARAELRAKFPMSLLIDYQRESFGRQSA